MLFHASKAVQAEFEILRVRAARVALINYASLDRIPSRPKVKRLDLNSKIKSLDKRVLNYYPSIIKDWQDMDALIANVFHEPSNLLPKLPQHWQNMTATNIERCCVGNAASNNSTRYAALQILVHLRM